MKNILFLAFALLLTAPCTMALDTVFDSMDSAKEVTLAPAVNTSEKASEVNVNSVYNTTLKEQKFNDALVNLDDAQVELRQELSDATSRYNAALAEKEKVVANCKAIKKEIKEINAKMKNIDKSKKMINKNLDTNQ